MIVYFSELTSSGSIFLPIKYCGCWRHQHFIGRKSEKREITNDPNKMVKLCHKVLARFAITSSLVELSFKNSFVHYVASAKTRDMGVWNHTMVKTETILTLCFHTWYANTYLGKKKKKHLYKNSTIFFLTWIHSEENERMFLWIMHQTLMKIRFVLTALSKCRSTKDGRQTHHSTRPAPYCPVKGNLQAAQETGHSVSLLSCSGLLLNSLLKSSPLCVCVCSWTQINTLIALQQSTEPLHQFGALQRLTSRKPAKTCLCAMNSSDAQAEIFPSIQCNQGGKWPAAHYLSLPDRFCGNMRTCKQFSCSIRKG